MVLNIKKTIIFIILLLPITTLLQGIGIFSNINKLFLGLLLVLLFANNMRKMTKKEVSILFFTFIVWINSCMNIKIKYLNINEIFYFLLWVLFFIFFKNNNLDMDRYLFKYKNLIKYIIFLWIFLVIISLGYSDSYYTEWGKTKYFKSFADNSFRFASTCLFIMVLIGLYSNYQKDWRYLILSLIPIVCVAASGSRTYLFLILILFIPLYYKNVSKSIFIVSCIPICVIIAYMIFSSNMMDKFEYVNYVGKVNNESMIETITSGRTTFWLYDLKCFFNCNLEDIIIGKGITYPHQVNAELYSTAIQSHNDYINVLLSYGIIGIIIYIVVFRDAFKSFCAENFIEKKYKFIYCLIYFLNAFMNGVLYYINSMLALPIILLMYKKNERER